MSQTIGKKKPRFSPRQRLILIGMVILVASILAVLAGFSVRARGPRPAPTPVITATPTSTAIPAPSIRVSSEDVADPNCRGCR